MGRGVANEAEKAAIPLAACGIQRESRRWLIKELEGDGGPERIGKGQDGKVARGRETPKFLERPGVSAVQIAS